MKAICKAITLLAVVALLGLIGGCRAEECQKMSRCCAAIEEHQAVGGACGELAEGVKDPSTCRTVLKTARAIFEKRGEAVPKACR